MASMSNIKTPGVYVEEIRKFPPSVAGVSTAIPAFIGYTEKAIKDGAELINLDGNDKIITPVRIKYPTDYELYFGGPAEPKSIQVGLSTSPPNEVEKIVVEPTYHLYHSVKLFFDNGGGDCFIVPVGTYKEAVNKDHFIAGLEAIKKMDEPTILLAPDGVLLAENDLKVVYEKMLEQCKDLQDRFVVMDVKHNPNVKRFNREEIKKFRNIVGMRDLNYGAAYFPYLRTTYSYPVRYDLIQLDPTTISAKSSYPGLVGELDKVYEDIAEISVLNKFINNHIGLPAPFDQLPYSEVAITQGFDQIEELGIKEELENKVKYINELLMKFISLGDQDVLKDDLATNSITLISNDAKPATEIHSDVKTGSYFESLMYQLMLLNTGFPTKNNTFEEIGIVLNYPSPFNSITVDITDSNVIEELKKIYGDPNENTELSEVTETRIKKARPYFRELYDRVLSMILNFREKLYARAKSIEDKLYEIDPFYRKVVQAIQRQGILLPPSGAVAGVYAAVDNDRGVWKAPANVSLNSVIAPTVFIDKNDQEDMNVDANTGKSVNAIRFFTGKGTLVWGARTLAGNDNEWRYIPVRRFYIFAEESIKKATEPFVFEPNDSNTWVRVRSMIENFLTIQWRAGALAGTAAEDAFFVKVGLGETMTAVDILEGRMIVEVGMAVVRPAEFIILRFSHKMQES